MPQCHVAFTSFLIPKKLCSFAFPAVALSEQGNSLYALSYQSEKYYIQPSLFKLAFCVI